MSHTGLNLTSPIRFDLVWIGQVTLDYITGQNMTNLLRLV